MKSFTLLLIKIYRQTLSRILVSAFGYGCRFSPTCGEYAILAIEKHGVSKGSRLSLNRLLRCNPFSNKYYDPVPNKLIK